MTKNLSILFAGQSTAIELIDGSRVSVFVRALPQRYLHHVLAAAEWKHALVQLCTYLPSAPEKLPAGEPLVSSPPSCDYPDVPPPFGMAPVPSNWSDNLTDGSLNALYQAAKALNFQRAAAWARDQIAAKREVAPLHQAALEQVMPLVNQVLAPLISRLDALLISTPSAPSSSGAPASSS